jgi:choline dehydrogenase-like flavoprotein
MSLPVNEAVEDGSHWDVVVVGTGMGGATVGYELARRGLQVLFLERGKFVQRGADIVRGELGEPMRDAEERMRRGHWPRPIEGDAFVGETAHASDRLRFFAPLGCGTGGSTLLYGATLERFFPCDFVPRANFPHDRESTLPETWPVSHGEFEPYYQRAEQLYRVHGTVDPLYPGPAGQQLPPPPPLNPRDRSTEEFLQGKGLHPYRLHVGCKFVQGCDGCGGTLCLRDCKGDAGGVSLVPAVERHGARVLTECEVIAVESDRRSVRRVRCLHRGRELLLHPRILVLAAGALMTPVLLLKSCSADWPDGLANGSGLVGRNLMFHAGDRYAILPGGRSPAGGFNKSLSFNDFYVWEGRKLGNVQSIGLQIDTGTVFAHLRMQAERLPRAVRALAPWLLLRALARAGELAFRSGVVFDSIVEDLPYHDNRIVLDARAENGWRFEYRYRAELAERSEFLRRGLTRTLGRSRAFPLNRGTNLNFGHPCGTCRFGEDPGTSVLDRSNRAHDVDNLYVVDASFFPSSGGVNPSLTIAANAIRVAEEIAGRR